MEMRKIQPIVMICTARIVMLLNFNYYESMSESEKGYSPDNLEVNKLTKEKYDLHKAPEVVDAVERFESRTGERVAQDPLVQIQTYFDRFHEITDREDPELRERGIEAIKRLFHKKYVIQPDEIPEGYWENQRRIIRERGQQAELDRANWEELKRQNTEAIIADQEASLDTWIDYLASSDAPYPDALKYFTLRNVLNMSSFDKERGVFPKRSQGTTKPFPELNREALAYALDALEKKYKGYDIDISSLTEEDQQEFEKLLQSENFPKLYTWAIEKSSPVHEQGLANISGQWVKYDQGSDHIPLVESLQGHGTGWCTAGESTARMQLQGGDFYVYYSNDNEGKPTVPRVAIRMEENRIAEIRGIAKDQNMDEFIAPVVEQKLEEFGEEGNAYQKKVADMKLLTEIECKSNVGEQLTPSELRFLYEIDDQINGFGYDKDSRIEEIIAERDMRSDLANVFNCESDQISFTKDEALNGNILYHYGSLHLYSLQSAEGLQLPETVGGYLYLSGLQSAEGLQLPKTVSGYLDLSKLRSAEGFQFPQTVGGDLNLYTLQSAEGLLLPEKVGGNLNLRSLRSAEGLKLPATVLGYLDLRSIQRAEDLQLSETVGEHLDLSSLLSAEGLKLPEKVGGLIRLSSLPDQEKEILRSTYPHLKFYFRY